MSKKEVNEDLDYVEDVEDDSEIDDEEDDDEDEIDETGIIDDEDDEEGDIDYADDIEEDSDVMDDDEEIDLTDSEQQENIESMIEQDKNKPYERIPDKERISRPVLTKYEVARIIGTRTKQLTDGAQAMVEYDKDLSFKEIAMKELLEDKLPFIVKRFFHPDNTFEIFRLNELEKTTYSVELKAFKEKLNTKDDDDD